jgi:hypothetical protein
MDKGALDIVLILAFVVVTSLITSFILSKKRQEVSRKWVNCRDCRYWQINIWHRELGLGLVNRCHRHAPQPHKWSQLDEERIVWPVTKELDGCFEGERK